MANTVMIQADKARNLKFGVNALIELEELVGKPLEQLTENAGLSDMRVMLYVGLKWEDKKLTLEGTGDVMDAVIQEGGIETLANALGKAMELAFGGTSFPKEK